MHTILSQVIDSSTNQVVGKPIPVGTNPIGITFNPASGKLYVSSINDNMISVISSQINSVIGNPIQWGFFRKILLLILSTVTYI